MAEPASNARARSTDETVKETVESIIIAFILAFVFRAYVVEAFVIPTGSMAPTLLGAHTTVTCDQCGYTFTVSWPESSTVHRGPEPTPIPLRRKMIAVCPMCHYPNIVRRHAVHRAGDRILVHKYIYSYTNPRRWDVVVFKEPKDPDTNFIKRLVGLPNEDLHLFEGNLYVRPTDPQGRPTGDWRIARKTVRPDVQRAVWQPIYHSQYIPLDGGDHASGRYAWSVPWTARTPSHWKLADRRSYDYDGRGSGVIRFGFEGMGGGDVGGDYPYEMMYPYNQSDAGRVRQSIEDVRLAAAVQPRAPHETVTLSTTARLNNKALSDRVERLEATIHADGRATLQAVNPDTGEARTLKQGRVAPLAAGEVRRLELWYVDQEASLWVAGRRVLRWDYDIGLKQLRKRPRPQPTPNIAIRVSGGPATLHHVQVDRDLYYSIHNINPGSVARGALFRNRPSPPLHLGPNDFFCLGDNGPRSFDGRYWNQVDPWIQKRMLHGRIQRGEDPAGVVPRDLMIGRAFFVYFPAPYALGYLPVPDFGDMRFIH